MRAEDVARAVVYMASLPLDANVATITVLPTKMPYRGPWVDFPEMTMIFIKHFDELGSSDIDQAGGKGANLGELTHAGLPVPRWLRRDHRGIPGLC